MTAPLPPTPAPHEPVVTHHHDDGPSHLVQDAVYAIVGVLLAGFAIKTFLLPNSFLDGGATGMSLLLHELNHFPLPVALLLFNIPFLLMGGFQIGWKFAFRSLAAIMLLGLCIEFLPYPQGLVMQMEKAPILPPLFGGFFLGLGVGLGMRGGTALDGIEVLAVYTLKRSSLTITEIILGINIVIFLVAALFLHDGWEKALYAMLTYYVATRTIDYVVEGFEEYTGVTIISGQSALIKEALVLKLGRGITVYKGERGFLKDSFEKSAPVDIVFTVITRLEVRRLRNVVSAIDPKAFVFTNTIKEAAGGVLKRHAKH